MLSQNHAQKLVMFAQALLDQNKARVLIEPQKRATGFWYGGGNMVEAADGTLYLTGRYRNFGDSRTGLDAGTRGLELALFESKDQGKTFDKIVSFSKKDLDLPGMPVMSIEGSALRLGETGVELFVSSEKEMAYPDDLVSYQKPGTGVWTIERLHAPTVASLQYAPIETVVSCIDPRWLHCKDPVIHELGNGDTLLSFCTHPFNWASSNSAYTLRARGEAAFTPPVFDFFRRGFTWDVAISRITGWLQVPARGVFADYPPVLLAFYDGGESMRNLESHVKAVNRPRGYSCEEIGGLAYTLNGELHNLQRLSLIEPLFLSPHGSGCSRYVSVMQASFGLVAIWEQSQPDLSQPLMINCLAWDEVDALLSS